MTSKIIIILLPTPTVRCYAMAQRWYAPKREHSKATLWALCLELQLVLEKLKSDLRIGYLDDLTLGGSKETVAADVQLIETESKNLGLLLNRSKCETECHDIRMTIDDQAFHDFTNMSFDSIGCTSGTRSCSWYVLTVQSKWPRMSNQKTVHTSHRWRSSSAEKQFKCPKVDIQYAHCCLWW